MLFGIQGICMVGIIIPNYGHECYLPDAIASLIKQDNQNWTATIYNDDDRPDKALQYQFQDWRIKCKDDRKRKGQAARFNQGIVEMENMWIGFMGADDMAMPWKIFSLSHKAGADVIYTDAVQLMEGDKRLYIKSGQSIKDIEHHNFIVASTVFVRRQFLMDHVIRFDESLSYGEDWYFYNQLAIAGARFRYLPWPTVYYREHTSNIMIRGRPEWHQRKKQIYDKIQQLYNKKRVITNNDTPCG